MQSSHIIVTFSAAFDQGWLSRFELHLQASLRILLSICGTRGLQAYYYDSSYQVPFIQFGPLIAGSLTIPRPSQGSFHPTAVLLTLISSASQ